MMGSELHLHVVTAAGDNVILRLPTVDLDDATRRGLSYGNKLYFNFPAKVMHLFDPKTEESLLY